MSRLPTKNVNYTANITSVIMEKKNNTASAVINNVKIDKDIQYDDTHLGLGFLVDFDLYNIKDRLFCCRLVFSFIIGSQYELPIPPRLNDPKDLFTDGYLSLLSTAVGESDKVNCKDWYFKVPYYVLCGMRGVFSQTNNVVVEIQIGDLSNSKNRILLTSIKRKFTVTCRKKLFKAPIFEVTL